MLVVGKGFKIPTGRGFPFGGRWTTVVEVTADAVVLQPCREGDPRVVLPLADLNLKGNKQ